MRDQWTTRRDTANQSLTEADGQSRDAQSRRTALETQRTEGQQRLVDETARGEATTQAAQNECTVSRSDALKRRRDELEARCGPGPRMVVAGWTFDLAELGDSLLRARPKRDGVARVEITVGTAGTVTADLWPMIDGLVPSTPPQRSLVHSPVVLTVGAVRWDLTPYLGLSVLGNQSVDVALTVGSERKTLRLDRAGVLETFCAITLALVEGPPFAFTAPGGTTLDTAGRPAAAAVTGPVPAITTALTLNGSSYVGLTGLPRPGPCVVRRTASGRRSPATSRSSFGSA